MRFSRNDAGRFGCAAPPTKTNNITNVVEKNLLPDEPNLTISFTGKESNVCYSYSLLYYQDLHKIFLSILCTTIYSFLNIVMTGLSHHIEYIMNNVMTKAVDMGVIIEVEHISVVGECSMLIVWPRIW